MRHCSKNHEGETPNCENLSPDANIEEWVMTLLKRQSEAIKKNQEKLNKGFGSPGSSKSPSPLKQNSPRSPGKSLLKTSVAMELEPEFESDGNNEDLSNDDVPDIVDEGED